jgi:hypothetical protein
MNWKVGLFRAWLSVATLWLFGVSYFAFAAFNEPAPFRGDYQYVIQSKAMTWNTDWSKPLYDIAYPPGQGRFPDEFAPIGEKYREGFDKTVTDGKTVSIEFSDLSKLYFPAELTKADQTYLTDLFWQQRWYRYWWKIAPWLAWAFYPPLAVLILGVGIRWVRGGFANKPAY